MVATSKLVVGQHGNQLWTTFFLFDKAVANPDGANMIEYERMIDTDETVAAGIEFMQLSVLNKLDKYVNESSKEIQTFVNECLEQIDIMSASFDMLSALWAGYSGTEIVYKADGGRIVWDYLATYHPRTVFFNIERLTGRLDKEAPIKQWRWFDGSPVDIPGNKSIVFTHNGRFGNPYGTSQLKRTRKNWLLKDPVLKMWVNAVDKFGTPLVAAMVPDGDIPDPENPKTPDGDDNLISNIVYMSRLLANLQNGTGLAMSSGRGDEKSDIKSLTAGGTGMGQAFESLVGYLNKMIFRALLAPSLIFDEGQRSGSYALGQSHFDIYTMELDRIYREFTEKALIQQLVRPLIDYNFGPQKDYGSFPMRELDEDDMQKLADVFEKMTQVGYLDQEDIEHVHYVQAKLGFPLTKLGDLARKRKEKQDELASYLDDPEEKEDALDVKDGVA